MNIINGYTTQLVQFSQEDIDTVKEQVNNLRLNHNGANGLERSITAQQNNKLMGFLAEKAVYNTLRETLGSLVHKKETDITNQIDMFIGTKTVEVRSSQVKQGIRTALFAKRSNGDSVYHLVGSYTNSYKKKEIVKDYYIWVVFEDSFEHCYIVGGATKAMIEAAPLVTMVPKGKTCNNPGQYRALRPDKIYQFDQLLKLLTPSANERLSLAKQNKEDEFYTRYETVEKELQHYGKFFVDKIVYLPCDNPDISNFWKYFRDNFKKLGLKELRSTFLGGKLTVYDGNLLKEELLTDTGSFDTQECLTEMIGADIIVTNPPFSLFRQFVLQLVYINKDFLIIGNQNAATTKEIFPLFQQDKIRYGYNLGSETFQIPDDYETRSANVRTDSVGKRYLQVEGIRWFTTLSVNISRQSVVVKSFSPFVYQKYDNYNAYEVSLVKDIPDYEGELGVPISYLNVYNPQQFELVGISDNLAGPVIENGKVKEKPGRFYLKGKRLYQRIVIKKRGE